jgi:hypothetical protein
MRTVDPGKILMTFKGVNIVGIADGTFVEVERAEDGWTMYKGSDGEITRVRNRDRSGAVTFTLSQASITNTFLSAIAIADEKDGTGVGSLLIKDLNGGMDSQDRQGRTRQGSNHAAVGSRLRRADARHRRAADLTTTLSTEGLAHAEE